VARPNIQSQISRHRAPVRSITLWTAICAASVVLVHIGVARTGFQLDSYASGTTTLAAFVLAAAYSLRRRSLWPSLRLLQLTARLPNAIASRILSADRLETWRFVHVAIGIFLTLPLWWHIEAALRAGIVEIALAVLIALVILSGILGALIQEFLPHAMQLEADHEVRLQDVENALDALYNEAEEAILGHSDRLITTYLETIRPILRGPSPWFLFLRATLTGTDPSAPRSGVLRARAAELGNEADVFRGLVEVAARKLRLEQNRFNLLLGVGWLRVHIALMLLTAFVIVFHVLGILYLDGL
jgi:hypothetical protein